MKIKVTCFINLTRLPLPYQVLACPAQIIKEQQFLSIGNYYIVYILTEETEVG